jgi:uncharacterized protein YegP (UPF0339 family)
MQTEDQTEMYYLMYREASSNLWRWTLYNENGRMVAQSVEKYYNKDDCQAAIDVVRYSRSVPIRERQPA